MSTINSYLPEVCSTTINSEFRRLSEIFSVPGTSKEVSSLLTPSLLVPSLLTPYTSFNNATSTSNSISSTLIIDDDTLSTISCIDVFENEPNQINSEESNEQIKVVNEEKRFSINSIISPQLIDKAIIELKEFLLNVCPIDINRWNGYKFYKKLIELIKSPAYLLMTLTIPVVDYESPKNNWCRSLNCLHIVTSPQIALFYLDCKLINKITSSNLIQI